MSSNIEINLYSVDGEHFELPSTYQPKALVGCGSYGAVCVADVIVGQLEQKQCVALKKISFAYNNSQEREVVILRTLREIVFLQAFRLHHNIINLVDIQRAPYCVEPCREIYLATTWMELPLSRGMQTYELGLSHIQILMYQLLRGLKYIHSAGVIHRDIKPDNLLIDESLDLKICDFGFAQCLGESDNERGLTVYAGTRWYRSPELLAFCERYDQSVDIWSAGCVFGELLRGGKGPLFAFDRADRQLSKIVDFVNPVLPEDVEHLQHQYMRDVALHHRKDVALQWELLFEFNNVKGPVAALDLLRRMLAFNPSKRISAAQALQHPFFEGIHDPSDEPDFEGDRVNVNDILGDEERLRRRIDEEISKFHNHLRW